MSKNKPSYKVEYSSEDQEWNAFERGFWGWKKIRNTFSATKECTTQRLQSYIANKEKIADQTTYY